MEVSKYKEAVRFFEEEGLEKITDYFYRLDNAINFHISKRGRVTIQIDPNSVKWDVLDAAIMAKDLDYKEVIGIAKIVLEDSPLVIQRHVKESRQSDWEDVLSNKSSLSPQKQDSIEILYREVGEILRNFCSQKGLPCSANVDLPNVVFINEEGKELYLQVSKSELLEEEDCVEITAINHPRTLRVKITPSVKLKEDIIHRYVKEAFEGLDEEC